MIISNSDWLGSVMGLFGVTTENSTLASRPWKNGQTFWSSFEFYPEWRGGRFDIFRGIAHHERQWWTKTDVVVRTFKHTDATHADWSDYCRCSDEARKLVQHFNKLLTSLGIAAQVVFTVPALVVMDNISEIMILMRLLMRFNKRFGEDEVVAFEELIEGDFKVFVDESGNVTENGAEMLAALCHFSYHHSNGEYILSNFKGVKNGPDHEEKPNTFHLTTPSFHSKTRAYGSTDMGETGIQEFFKTHQCSAICKNFDSVGWDTCATAPLCGSKYEQNKTTPKLEAENVMKNEGLVRPPSYEESISENHQACT